MSKESENTSGFGDPQGEVARLLLLKQRYLQLLLGEEKYEQSFAQPVRQLVKDGLMGINLEHAKNHLSHQE